VIEHVGWTSVGELRRGTPSICMTWPKATKSKKERGEGVGKGGEGDRVKERKGGDKGGTPSVCVAWPKAFSS
jgi:hypothetical protein